MKRNGFTLAEALIALAIVGVIAAVTASAINRFKPDANKVTYLKNYDALVEVVSFLANDNAIYPVYNGDEQRELYKDLLYDKYPLYNTVAITHGAISASAGAQKLCELLAMSLSAVPSSIACNNTDLEGTSASFTTKTGEDYIVSTTIKDPAGLIGYYKSEILLDLDGLNKGSNTTYKTNKNDPDRFNLVVYATGQVRAADTKGLSYLTTRSSYRKVEDPSTVTYVGEQSELEEFNLEYVN